MPFRKCPFRNALSIMPFIRMFFFKLFCVMPFLNLPFIKQTQNVIFSLFKLFQTLRFQMHKGQIFEVFFCKDCPYRQRLEQCGTIQVTTGAILISTFFRDPYFAYSQVLPPGTLVSDVFLFLLYDLSFPCGYLFLASMGISMGK